MSRYSVFFKPNFIPDGTNYPNVSTVMGTISISAGISDIIGSRTNFLSTLTVGQYIAWIDDTGVRRQAQVGAIVDDVTASLSVIAVPGSTGSAVAYQAVFDITDRLTVSGVPKITVGTQRRENPFLLTYGELSLTFTNIDGYFDNLLNMDKIIGTDPANYRAPLLHYGVIYFARKEFGRAGGFQNVFLGFVDPKSLRYNRDSSTCSFTGYGIAKILERGNAERVHRFASLYAAGLPQPFVLSGYDLGHPAAPPGIQTLTPTVAGSIPLVACDPATAIISGNLTLFTRDLRIGNTITINGVSATIKSIEDDGHLTLTSLWGGVNTFGAFTAFMYYSGQSDSCFRLSRNSLYSGPATEAKDLQFFPGDIFKGVGRVLPSDYVEGMDLVEISAEATIKGTAAIGNDLLITTVDPVPEASMLTGVASMQVITPWWRGKRYTRLIQLLVDEVNLALSAASYSDIITLVEDAFSSTTGQPVLDIIDNNGLVFPVTGFGWYIAAGGATRWLAQSAGFKGQLKADFLLDPVTADRTFNTDLFNTAPTVGTGGNQVKFMSPTYGLPYAYPNPSPILGGIAPPPDIALTPSVGQDYIKIAASVPVFRAEKIHTRWTLCPLSYQSAAAAVKYAYRIESFDVAAGASYNIGGGETVDLWENKVGFTLGLYTTAGTVPNETWSLVSQSVISEIKGPQSSYPVAGLKPGVDQSEPIPPVETVAQGQVMTFQVVGLGNYLYLITDGGKRKAYWYKSAGGGDHVAPSTITAGMTLFGWNAGNRSGTLYDGTNIFYFEDRSDSESLGIGTIAGSAASGTITGTNTKFIRDLRNGDKIIAYNVLYPLPKVFTVQSDPVSDTSCTVLPVIGAGGLTAQNYHIVKTAKGGFPTMHYWDGATMALATFAAPNGLPSLVGADWAHATIDGTRGIIYVVCGRVLYRLEYTIAVGLFTITSFFTASIDTPNYDGSAAPASHVGPQAWLSGPVDINMGTVDGAVTYPLGTDAMLVGTLTQDYIYSDEFAGVIKVADFTGMSCSTAIESLIQIPQQVLLSGCDTDTTADPSINDPAPTIRLKPRIINAAAPYDATLLAVSCQDELWICQYTSIQVQNSQLLQNFQGSLIPIGSNINTGIVINDKTFTFDSVLYKVLAARYGGVNALQLDNPFIFSTSVAKMIANAYAFEFLIPRSAAKLKILDPFLIDGATILLPLGKITYLKSPPNAYGVGVTATGKILKLSYELENNVLDIEVA